MLSLRKIFLTLFLLGTLPVYSGVKITTESHDHTNKSKTSGVVLIDGDMVRVDMDTEGGQAIIYDLQKKVVTIINHQEKSWVRLTKKQIDESRALIKKQMENIMEQQEAVLQNLPPEQREKVRAQMKEIAGSAEVVKVQYKKSDKKGKWRKKECQIYDGMIDGTKVEELCTVAPEKLKCSLVEIEKLKQVSTDFAIDNQQEGVSAWNNIKEIGVPVIHKSIENGKVSYTNILITFENKKIPVEKFKIPDNYKEVKMPSLNNMPPPQTETKPPATKEKEKPQQKKKESAEPVKKEETKPKKKEKSKK